MSRREIGRRALLDRRQRPVERMLHLQGRGGRARRVAAQSELLGSHVTGRGRSPPIRPVGGVVEVLGGPGGRSTGRRPPAPRAHQHLDRGRQPRRRRQDRRPPAPASAAAHNATLTAARGGMQQDRHGEPEAGPGRLTTALLRQATETAIMISSEDPMQASATRPRRLARACASPGGPVPVGPVPVGPVPVGPVPVGPVPVGRAAAGSLRLPGAPGAGPWPLAR